MRLRAQRKCVDARLERCRALVQQSSVIPASKFCTLLPVGLIR